MRKMVFIMVVAALLLGVLPLQAGMPLNDLTALARYFPADAPVFMAFRTDDGMISELDNVVSRVTAKLPEGTVPPGVQLSSLLDMGSMQTFGEDFATGVRSWLGDTAVLGFTSPNAFMGSDPDYLMAISITDREKAEAAILAQYDTEDYQITTEGNFTVITPNNSSTGPIEGAIAIGDEIMLIGRPAESLPLAGVDGDTLADSADFNATTALLPEDAYGMAVYVALADIMRPMAGYLAPEDSPVDPAAMFDALGSMALGITVLDERSIVLDMAFNTGDLTVLSDLGIAMNGEPIDPAFTAHLPADSMWAVQGTNLKRLYDSLLTSARLSEADPEQFDANLAQVKDQIQQFTQLDLDEDIIGWMTGNAAAFVTVDMPTLLDAITAPSPDGDIPFQELPFGFGILIEATDPAKAQALSEALGKVLPMLAQAQPEVTIAQEEMGGIPVTVINGPLGMGSDSGSGSSLMMSLVIGATEDYFLIATRAEAKAILSGSPGLDTAPAFIEASQYILDDPAFFWYSPSIMSPSPPLVIVGLTLMGPAIGNVFENIVTELESPGGPPTLTPEEVQRQEQERLAQQRQTRALVEAMLNMASSSSISSTMVDGDNVVSRFVITLAE